MGMVEIAGELNQLGDNVQLSSDISGHFKSLKVPMDRIPSLRYCCKYSGHSAITEAFQDTKRCEIY